MSTRDKGEGSVYQRAGSKRWFGSAQTLVGQDGKRTRKYVSAATKAECLNKLHKLQQDIRSGAVASTGANMTVAQWVTHWLETIARPNLKPSTFITYRGIVNRHIIPNLGVTGLDKLEPGQIRAMHKAITDAGRSTRTAEQAHRILSKSLHDAVNDGVLSYAVTDRVKPPKVVMKQRIPLTAVEAKTMLRVALKTNDPNVTRWATYLLLGARQAEVLGLQWDRIDFEHGTIDISWQLTRLPLKPGAAHDDPSRFDVPAGLEYKPLWRGYALTNPKTAGSRRIIPLPEPLAALLYSYAQQCDPNPWGLVWVGESGQPIRSTDDTEAWHDALSRAEVTDTPVHGARHTTATLLLEAGVDAHVVAAILGHSVITTTYGYQHASTVLTRNALQKLENLIQGDGTV